MGPFNEMVANSIPAIKECSFSASAHPAATLAAGIARKRRE
ncbi:hypothetical protein ACTVJQ_003673 [Providencia stuartii]